jgi:DNA (cytosine-5)-methyltransferase 1
MGLTLPRKGEVELIVCRPPCQGFSSGHNRHKNLANSKFENPQLSTCLEAVDHFHPNFFLLKNLETFMSFQGGLYISLTFKCLVDMG